MATRFAWLLNLDADVELCDPLRYARERKPFDLGALAARIFDLVAPTDVILEQRKSASADSSLIALAFCPTPSARARIEACGLTAPRAPELSILRAVNDRAFCASLGHGLPGARFATTLTEIEDVLRVPSFSGRYVLKRAFSFAGRETRRVAGSLAEMDSSTRGFCERSFERGEGIQVEPWVDRTLDFSRHGFVSETGDALFGATREQRCDPMGRFESMSSGAPELSEDDDATLLDTLRSTAEALHAAGYFGPFGIDGFRYRDSAGGTSLSARCEINARFTMGFPRDLLERVLSSGWLR